VAFEAVAIPGVIAEESDSDEDESEEQPGQPGQLRADHSAAGGERRPRRRGRRGGRRRRGGLEDGLAGSIVDELTPAPPPEAESAVADFDGAAAEQPAPEIQPQPIAPTPEPQHPNRAQQEAARLSVEAESAQEAERAARRRSTVREKVSFLVDQRDVTPPDTPSQPEPAAPPAPAAEPASETTTDTQPRRAGWWSRRFGSGE
jgi:ribonuclease E